MIIDDRHYDVIIVGTGAGGGTLAWKLAATGKQILILERGNSMPLEEQNRSDVDVFKRERYHAPEQWYDSAGEPFSPQMNYAVGGNTKIYGSVLMRFRERDFEAVEHQNGISPAWCVKYAEFEPYYTEAETLYRVHGDAATDPTEPPHSQGYPHAPIAHEPQIAQIYAAIAAQGLHPSPLPLGLTGQDDDPTSDAETNAIAAVTQQENVTLKVGATVTCLHTNSSGLAVKAVQAEIAGQPYLFFADIVVLACGAINSAALLLRSVNNQHPQGLANSSDLVGRNLMKSLMTSVTQLSANANSGVFPKTVGVNDFYWGDGDFPYPMGHIQNTGGLLTDVIFAEAPPLTSVLARYLPGFGLKQLAIRSVGWWAQTADLPDPNNRVRIERQKLYVEYAPNNLEAHDRLVYRWVDALKEIETQVGGFQPGIVHPRATAPIQVMANQCGTCCFGDDPATSVLDRDCRTHDLDNLYVVDGSFFPASASVSPALTIMANALRVGDRLRERLA